MRRTKSDLMIGHQHEAQLQESEAMSHVDKEPQLKRKSSTSLELRPKRRAAKSKDERTSSIGVAESDEIAELKPNRILSHRQTNTPGVEQYLVECRTGRSKDSQLVDIEALSRMASPFHEKQDNQTSRTFTKIDEAVAVDNNAPRDTLGEGHTNGTSSIPLPDASEYHLNSGNIARAASDIFLQIKSQIHQDFVARGHGDTGTASFSLHPSPDLARLYVLVTGNASSASAKKAAIVSSSTGAEVVVAIAGTYLLSEFFAVSPEWLPSYDKFAASHHSTVALCDEILSEHKTNMDTILRKAYFRRCHDQSWIESDLHPHALDFSQDLAALIEQHLGHLTPTAALFLLAQRLFKIVLHAIVLKCKLSTARERVEYTWYSSGASFDAGNMESANGDGEEVLLTSFPGILMRHDDGIEVVAKATVWVV